MTHEPEIDYEPYVPVERQKVECGERGQAGDEYGWRYVRLTDGPMPSRECLPWLIENGYVKKVPDDHPESETGYRLVGWGTTYFMCPWDKAVER